MSLEYYWWGTLVDKNVKFILFLILSVYIIIPLYDYYTFPRFEKVNYFNLVLESATSLFALSLLFAVQFEKRLSTFNWSLNLGIFLLIFSTFVDAIDQIFIHSIIFTALFEKITLLLSFSLILYGILVWKKKFDVLLLTDDLTLIPNRMAIDQFVNEAITDSIQVKKGFHLAIIDIDFFKNINDRFGHKMGDKTLIDFAQLLQSYIASDHAFGRWGGEEFVVLLKNMHTDQVKDYLNQLRLEISEHEFNKSIQSIRLTVSIGLAQWENQDSNLDNLFVKADRALYQAKNAGRNTLVID